MQPTNLAIVTPDRTPTLEQAREDWRAADAAEYQRRHEFNRAQARTLHHLYRRWTLETGLLSRRDFARWLTGEAEPPTRLYDALNAGYALAEGLDFDYGVTALSFLGRALDSLTPAEIMALPEAERVDHCKALVVSSKAAGVVKLPAANLPDVRRILHSVSESAGVDEGQALAWIVEGHAAASPEMQAAQIEAARSGRTLTDAAQAVVRQMLDSRQWLSRQPCFIPSCGLPGQELHHLKLSGTRFRSQEVLVSLCHRHHQAQMGAQSAHANHQADWIAQHWPSEAEFWRDLSTMYAHRLFGPSGGLNSIQDGKNATME